jgi:hypothetical protein
LVQYGILIRRNLRNAFAEQAHAMARGFRAFAQDAGFDPVADAAARGYEKATAPIPLWNYDGYLVCDIQTKSGESRMVEGQAQARLLPSDVDLNATVQLLPEAPVKGASKRVLVTLGVEPEGSAAIDFEIEARADEIEVPGLGLVKLSASRGVASSVATLPLRVSPDAHESDTLTLYIVQSGRHLTTFKIPIVFPDDSSG